MSERVKMKSFVLIAVGLLGVVLTPSLRGAETSDRKPNIIYLMLDDAGYGDFSAFGSPHVKTPIFDRICSARL